MWSVCNVFSQSKSSIAYERSYAVNDAVVNTTTDAIGFTIDFKNDFSVFTRYQNTTLDLFSPVNFYSNEAIENLHSIDLGIKKKLLLGNRSSFTFLANPQVRTNDLEAIQSRAFHFNATAIFGRKLTEKSQLNLGVAYGNLLGSARFYPVFDYNYEFNKQLKISVGFPKTNLQWNWFTKNQLDFAVAYDTYYTTTTNAFSRMTNNTFLEYESLFFSKTKASLTYNYIFPNDSKVYLSLGKSWNNKLKIEENNTQSNSYDFSNHVMLSMGIKFNLNK